MTCLQAVLKTGSVIKKYVYCDVDIKLHAIIQRVSYQYPEQFPISAWSNASTNLAMDVHDITPRYWKRIGHVDLIIAGTECPPFSQAVKGAQGYADNRARTVPAVVQNIHYLYEIQEIFLTLLRVFLTQLISHRTSHCWAMNTLF